MKSRKVFLVTILAVVLATAAMTMTSCGNDDEVTNNNNDRVAVQFFSSSVQTRTDNGGDTWLANDRIGIFMVDNGTKNLKATNKHYRVIVVTSQQATFRPFSENDTIYYPLDNAQKVDFVAYYPYRSSYAPYTVDVSTTKQGNPALTDLLYADSYKTEPSGYSKADGQASTPVALTFEHQLVKLVLTVKAGTGLTTGDLSNLTVAIKGMYNGATFDLTGVTGFTNLTDNVTAIAPRDAGNKVYEAILLPVTTLNADHKVEFKIGNDTYTWELSGAGGIANGKLEGGNKYTYEVTLNKTVVSVKGTITPWENGDSGEKEAS
jgi:hypothetical protein